MARTITELGLKEFLSLTQGYVLERQGLAITHSAATWLDLSASPAGGPVPRLPRVRSQGARWPGVGALPTSGPSNPACQPGGKKVDC